MSPIQKVLDKLHKDQIAMIINGLDLLDEFYNTNSEFDKVMDVRTLKTTLRDHVPTHLLN